MMALSGCTSRRNHEDDTAHRIRSLLETRNLKPMKMARNAVLHKEFRNVHLQKVTVEKVLRYFCERWLGAGESYALGPTVMALSCEAVGGDPETTIPVAAAVILIGSGAEFHDDIIDKSKTKNSQLTIFGKFGSATALIAGDMLLTKGFTLLNENLRQPTPRRMMRVIGEIKKAIFEHADAELLAFELTGRLDTAPEIYMEIIRMRSSIVEAQSRIGGLIGGGTLKEVEALGRYGRLLGTLSLIRGEFIDMLETEELDHRIMNECLPLPILLALQSKKEKGKIAEILNRRRTTRRDRAALVQSVLQARRLQRLRKEMCNMAQAADLSIESLRPEPVASLRLLTRATLMDI